MLLNLNRLAHKRVPHFQIILGFVGVLFLTITILVANSINQKHQRLTQKVAGEKVESTGVTKFLSNRLLIKLTYEAKNKIKTGDLKETGISSLDNIHKEFGVTALKQIVKQGRVISADDEINNWYAVSLPGSQEIISANFNDRTGKISSDHPQAMVLQKIIEKYAKDPSIEAFGVDEVIVPQALPNDPYYSKQWYLSKINAPSAWDVTTGSSDNNKIAIIDTGIETTQEDLIDNLWTNPGESGPTAQEGSVPNCTSRNLPLNKSCNNLDDDGNGYVDDLHGYNFYSSNTNIKDLCAHGTQVAGIAAASGNNQKGVTGVIWKAKLMVLKDADQCNGNTSSLMAALTYAINNKANVINISSIGNLDCFPMASGSTTKTCPLHNLIKKAGQLGIVVVAAAGNGLSTPHEDALVHTPANADFAITVSSTNENDAWPFLTYPYSPPVTVYWSNTGYKIDVAAPGTNLYDVYLSDTGANRYAATEGNSFSAPQVAGLAALLFAKNPNFTSEEIRQIIRAGADDIGEPSRDDYFGYGRINLGKSLNLSYIPLDPVITGPDREQIVSGKAVNITGSTSSKSDKPFSRYSVEISPYGAPHPNQWSTIKTGSVQVIKGSLAVFDSTSYPNGYYSLRLTSYDNNNNPYFFTAFNIYFNNPTPTIIPTVLPTNSVSITPTTTVNPTILPNEIPTPTPVSKRKGNPVTKPPKPR